MSLLRFSSIAANMIIRTMVTTAFVFLALALSAGTADAEPGLQADRLFWKGEFGQAAKAYRRILAKNPMDPTAALRLGQIAMLENRWNDAQKRLTVAARLVPANTLAQDNEPKRLLAELYYRELQFQKAAPLFREVGSDGMARKLESFAGAPPYQHESLAQPVRVPFVQTDPLPLIEVRVNGGKPLFFLIDTGAGEIIVDDALAKEVGISSLGSSTGRFAGDKRSTYEHGRLDSLTLGGLTVKNIPVWIQSTRRYAAVAPGKKVDGILGTVFLYEFLSTLDYEKGQLTLRPRNEHRRAKAFKNEIPIPFWLDKDHLMIAFGSVNSSPPMLMLVDTGLAGGGITVPASTLQAAGIKLSEESTSGIGAGGAVQVQPFEADKVSLGRIVRNNVDGIFGAFPSSLEDGEGFHIGGLISHQFFRPSSITFDFDRMELRIPREP
ncbi:MAG: aspartyl protease family protein [Terriglobales bacterium]|jgi:predicted aspartyl protease